MPRNSWDYSYELAKKYYEQYGNLKVPHSYVTPTGEKLGKWVQNQRQSYRRRNMENTRLTVLTDDQVAKLEKIGMMWNAYEASWEEYYELAKNYYEQYGNLKIPFSYMSNDKPLGVWLSTQRCRKDNEKSDFPLSDNQKKKLNEIGMIWNIYETSFDKYYQLAKKYYEQFDNLDIPRSYVTKTGEKLGKWIANQRLSYKNRSLPKEKISNTQTILTDERVSKLEEIGMIWNKKEYDFMHHKITASRKIELEKRLYKFISNYLKNNSNAIKNYSDIENINHLFSNYISNNKEVKVIQKTR